MPLDTSVAGSNTREIFVQGDPNSVSGLVSVGQFHNSDAQSLGGTFFEPLSGSVHLLVNAAGTFDRCRSAIGTTGILAVATEGSKVTYSVATIAFTPAATATDIWQVVGSNTKTVRVLRVAISGTATGAATVDIQAIKRTAANTGGTPVSQTIAVHDSNDAAASATVNTYSANPGALGAGVAIRGQRLNLGAAGSAGSIVWDFTTRNGKGLVLRGTVQALVLNWNGAAVPAGTSLAIDCEYSEE